MRRISIATIGTSLTNGFEAGGAWQPFLATELEARTSVAVTCYNFGIGAASSQTGLANMEGSLSTRPDVVVVEYATNDAFTSYGISPAQSEANVRQMITAFRNRDTDVPIFLMIMNALVPGSAAATARPNLEEYNDVYRDLAATPALNLGLIDNYDAWGSPPTNATIPDGLHPPIAELKQRLIPDMVEQLAPALQDSFG